MYLTIVCGVAAGCLLVRTSPAADLPPGETRAPGFHDVSPLPPESAWRGELLAERSQPFEFVGQPFEPGGTIPFARGTFTSQVFRDAGTGGLAFLYDFDQTEFFSTNDFERATLGAFGPFTTDVYFSQGFEDVTRSADGATLDYIIDSEDIDGTFLVRTNAPAFNNAGSLTVFMDFEGAGMGAYNQTFAAFQPVPEPSAALLLAIAAAPLIRRPRRR